MKKVKKVKVVQEQEKVIDILCNMCGESCGGSDKLYQEYNGLIEVEVSGGYQSTVIGDLISWRFSICETCLDKIVKKFKIPHEVKDSQLSNIFEPSNSKKRFKKPKKS